MTWRVGIVGLGTISTVVRRAYQDWDGAVVTAICDRDPELLADGARVFPDAFATTDLDELLARDDVDYVELLVPTPLHGPLGVEVLDAGKHLQLQKPMAISLADADALVAAAHRNDRVLRVTEDYCWFEPLMRLRDTVQRGDIGRPVGLHMKLVATGSGGWDVRDESWRWQFAMQHDHGLGMLGFDHGWHMFAVAHWLFGTVREVRAWRGSTEVAPGITLDAPLTIMWEHHNGVRAVMDIVLAPETYWASDYYTGDERFEVTGTAGFARVNRLTARGVGWPALEVYRDGVLESFPLLDDDWASALVRSTRHFAAVLDGTADDVSFDGPTGREILRFCLEALQG